MVSTVIPVQPFDLVIFGATGDLAHRKILPSLFRRLAVHQMPSGSRVIGAARSKMSRAEFRKLAREALTEFVEPKLLKPALVEEFLNGVDYVAVDATGEGGWATLAKKLDEKPSHVRAFYLSVAPSLFGPIAGRLSEAGIATPAEPDRRREAARPRPRLGAGAERRAREALRRAADLPDRPLPREGDGAEPDGDPLRQRAVRAALELALRRARADHRRRVDRGRRPRRLLRPVGRDARHGAEPPDAAPLPDRDGAAVEVRPRRGARREAQGDPRARSA